MRFDHKKMVFILILAGLILALGIAFFFLDEQKNSRSDKYDEQRVFDLQNISNRIIDYWQQNHFLPDTVKEVYDEKNYFFAPTDPQTGNQYEYNKTGDTTYEVCANFNRDSKSSEKPPENVPNGEIAKFESENWSHPQGKYCYHKKINSSPQETN